MKKRLRVLGLIFGLIATAGLAGCDDANGGDEALPEIDIDQENICETVAEVMCHNMFACCTGKEREEKLGEQLTVTQEDCIVDMTLECENYASEVLQASAAGTFAFEPEAANACVDALLLPEEGVCFTNESNPQYLELCMTDLLGSGIVGTGGACLWDFECAGSAYCNSSLVCADLPTAGEPCVSLGLPTAVCADGHVCDFLNSECTAYVGVGEECIELMAGSDFAPCEPESTFCAGADYFSDPRVPGTCTGLYTDGSTCMNGSECKSADCALGFCEADPSESCNESSALACPQGLCAGSEDLCASDADCSSGLCEHTCVGNVCYSEPKPVDYCEFGLDAPCEVFGGC